MTSRPSSRFTWPALFLAAALAALAAFAPLFVRTAGALGRWDRLFGVLLAAPLLLGLAWVWLARLREPGPRAQRWSTILAVLGVALLTASPIIPLVRSSLAAPRLRALGFRPAPGKMEGTFGKVLKFLRVSSDSTDTWTRSGYAALHHPMDEPAFVRAVRLLATCRTIGLKIQCPPQVRRLDSLALLHDLGWLELTGSIAGVDSDALGRLPSLCNLSIGECTLRNLQFLPNARYLELLKLQRLKLGELEGGMRLVGLPGNPSLCVLELEHLDSLQGFGPMPKLHKLVIHNSSLTDLAPLAAVAPKLEDLVLWQDQTPVPLESLARFHAMHTLFLAGIDFSLPTSRLPALPGLRSLTLLDCRGLPDLQGISAVAPDLEFLKISGNRPPLQLTGLAELPKLRKFHARGCSIAPTTTTDP